MKIPILGGISASSAYKIIMSIWERHINNLNIDIILEDMPEELNLFYIWR